MSLFRSEISKHLTSPDPGTASLAARTMPGMAHWAGTGPANATCGKCVHFGTSGKSIKQPCMKFARMTGGKVGNQIPPGTAACKYYEVKP